MASLELYERIHSWLWLYEHTPFPVSDDSVFQRFNTAMETHWKKEMLIDIVELKIPCELIGTPIESKLNAAIDFARSSNPNEIVSIRQLLMDVQIFLIKNKLVGNTLTSN